MITRRAFLGRAAAVPWVFGLAELGAQEKKGGEPAWLAEALGRMKETGRFGVVLVVPAGPEEQDRLGRALYALTELDDEDVEAHEIFCEAVVLCMTAESAARRFGELKGSSNRFLLSPEGGRLAADRVEPALFADSTKFAASFRLFLHGPANERLRGQAEAIGKRLPEELRRAVARLGSESAEERVEASCRIVRSIDGMIPLLVHAAVEGKDPEVARRARHLIRMYFSGTQEGAPGVRLPYGSTLPKFVNSCGSYVLEGGMSIGCGMARTPKRSGKFLRFLK